MQEDQQGRVDRALAAFIGAHKLDISIFCSGEWDDVLEAVNNGPVDVLSLDAEPAALYLHVLLLTKSKLLMARPARSRISERFVWEARAPTACHL